jgi:hypothetical protein
MAQPIEDRLRRLNQRRKGLDRIGELSFADQRSVLEKSAIAENWETRQKQNKYTQYALGAMQSVGSEYTEITVNTAIRVGNQLDKKLDQLVEFRLQGSVPLDIHIRGVSDVDLLVLEKSYLIFDRNGRLANTYTPSDRNQLDVILSLRTDAETILKAAYPEVKVDCSGAKAIKLTGGSLQRPVDVVPAIWYHTAEYQNTLQEYDAGVLIADKSVPETIENRPFLHIKLVDDRDAIARGGLKKMIRLAKNIKADSDRPELEKLSSFDIASLLYHSDINAIFLNQFYELTVLAELKRFLDWAFFNEVDAKALRTPDGSRAVIDTAEKYAACRALSFEVDDLAKRVAMEQQALTEDITIDVLAKALKEARLA